MSSDEEESEPEIQSLDDVQLEFRTEVGHLPHSVKQLLAYCRQKKHPHKFKDINGWWPNRPSPAEKPVVKAVNADDYRDPNEVKAEKGSDDDASDADADDNKDEDKEDDAEEPAKEESAAEDDADGADDAEPAAAEENGDGDKSEADAEKDEEDEDGGGDGDGSEDEEEDEEEDS